MSARWTASEAFAFIDGSRVYLVVAQRPDPLTIGDPRPWKWNIAGPFRPPGADGSGEAQTFEKAKRAALKAGTRLVAHLDAEKSRIASVAAGLTAIPTPMPGEKP